MMKEIYLGSEHMKIENKEMLLYCAQKSVNAVCKAGAEHVDETEAYFAIGTAIHWIVDCIDRIPKKDVKEEHESLFSALRCANNCLKHNATFKEAHQEEGLDFPFDFPFDFGIHYIWTSLDSVRIKRNKENQRNNYRKELEGENVFSTLSETLKIVNEYYEHL